MVPFKLKSIQEMKSSEQETLVAGTSGSDCTCTCKCRYDSTSQATLNSTGNTISLENQTK